MAELRAGIIIAVLMALILTVGGHDGKRLHARHFGGGGGHSGSGGHGGGGGAHQQPPCTNNPEMYQYYPPCSDPSSQPIPSTTEDSSSEEIIETTTTTSITASTSSEPTLLERAHWCRFRNGTYVPLGYSYTNNACTLCQCTKSRMIHCQLLQCMPTYCVDNSMPHRKAGQCCTQCRYEDAINSSCVYNGITYPHGAVMKVIESKMQCWCQLGNTECRNYIGSIFEGLNVFADGAAVYIIIMVLFVVIIFGLLLCSGCTLLFYFYYKRNQYMLNQAYDEYLGPVGWQPVEEGEEDVVDTSADEKRMEAEKHQFSESVDDLVPPPYGVFNGSYVPNEEQKKL